jgi:hypothetical protein
MCNTVIHSSLCSNTPDGKTNMYAAGVFDCTRRQTGQGQNNIIHYWTHSWCQQIELDNLVFRGPIGRPKLPLVSGICHRMHVVGASASQESILFVHDPVTWFRLMFSVIYK